MTDTDNTPQGWRERWTGSDSGVAHPSEEPAPAVAPAKEAEVDADADEGYYDDDDSGYDEGDEDTDQ